MWTNTTGLGTGLLWIRQIITGLNVSTAQKSQEHVINSTVLRIITELQTLQGAERPLSLVYCL